MGKFAFALREEKRRGEDYMAKISVRFYGDHEVRALWDEENSKWWFSVVDVVGALNGEENHLKNRNYWKYLKGRLSENSVFGGSGQGFGSSAIWRDAVFMQGVKLYGEVFVISEAVCNPLKYLDFIVDALDLPGR